MNQHIDRYVVMGNPIAHSKSPQIHHLFAQQTKQFLQYEKQCVPIGCLSQALTSFRDCGGRGANITLPFKEDAFQWVQACSARAKRARAINTILFTENGSSFGDNTDGIGIVRDLTHNWRVPLKNQRILILGAGGAVRGTVGSILEEEPEIVVIVNRNAEKAKILANEFLAYGTVVGCGYAQLKEQYNLIINGTSASLQGEMPDLPHDILLTNGVCYDMMYSAKPTVFMQWALEHNAMQAIDGLGMLVEQAAEAFYQWRGVRPNTPPVIDLLRQELKAS